MKRLMGNFQYSKIIKTMSQPTTKFSDLLSTGENVETVIHERGHLRYYVQFDGVTLNIVGRHMSNESLWQKIITNETYTVSIGTPKNLYDILSNIEKLGFINAEFSLNSDCDKTIFICIDFGNANDKFVIRMEPFVEKPIDQIEIIKALEKRLVDMETLTKESTKDSQIQKLNETITNLEKRLVCTESCLAKLISDFKNLKDPYDKLVNEQIWEYIRKYRLY